VRPLRTALITGGARRIGRSIVQDLARNGFAVVIHYNRSATEAEQLCAAISDLGGQAAAVRADLSDVAATEALVGDAAEHFGPIGLLVNNASAFEPDTAANFTVSGLDLNFDLHLKAPVMLTRKFAEQQDGGLVVNMIDQRVLKPTPRYFTYALSKAALWDATRIMAQSFAPKVRVNAIGPGPTLPNDRQTAEDFSAQTQTLLLKRGPSLDEFGRTIRYLWEAESVTGQMIALDGGQHLAWETPDATGME
jgi:NAD(P)-dependent dehydrogenase (short-subunit alcohol dehydrogenase family)